MQFYLTNSYDIIRIVWGNATVRTSEGDSEQDIEIASIETLGAKMEMEKNTSIDAVFLVGFLIFQEMGRKLTCNYRKRKI